ncbi:alpha/beta hydrolase [Paenibacillus sp. GbtcB18]|uniref:alpha/beta hydrolase n=1 Tax=Paenibacillus sp. GbtcB18 TaxID=2824763 RepID=UPI001C3066AD|nr:alpha/beta hydrolase [Paenibacillus sp. GbtcB18]
MKYVPETGSKSPSLLFLHGTNHGAWCWEEYFLPYFLQEGYPSYAVSYRGHGKSERGEKNHSFSLDDYVRDVISTINQLNIKPVLIGHSMGGAIAQKILNSYPNKITAVVLLASVSPFGMLIDYLKLLVRYYRKCTQLNSFNKGQNVHFPSDLFLSNKISREKLEHFVQQMQPESRKAMIGLLKRIVPKTMVTDIPILVLGSNTDKIFTARTCKSTAKFYKVNPIILPDLSHDMMLDSNWHVAADEILRFLQKLSTDETIKGGS